MKAADREATRARALELLHATQVVIRRRPMATLDDLLLTARSYEEQRAEMAVFAVIAQVFVAHGLSWVEFFTPVQDLGAARLREILDDAIDLIRRA